MRLRIILHTDRTLRLPAEHLHTLQGVVYRLLGATNPTLAAFLHDDGYQSADNADSRRYKFFAFSGLRVPPSRRRMDGAMLVIAPGTMEWTIASPKEDFLRGEIDALLRAGGAITLHGQRVQVAGIEALPAPDFSRTLACTCLTPIIAAVPSPDGRLTPLYLRPCDGERFGEAVRGEPAG